MTALCASCSVLLDPVVPGRVGPSDAGPSPDTGMTPPIGGDLAFGDRCEGDFDCKSLYCRDQRCSAECDTAEPCPDGAPTECRWGLCRFTARPPILGDPRVGYLYVGPVGDHGWTKTHDDGKQYLQAEIPTAETYSIPSVGAADAIEEIDRLIDDGHNVIVGTSFDFLLAMQNRAANYPDVNFLICSGFHTSPNLGSYFGRMYQVMWMAGRLAGKVTKTNKIGLVGPVVIPETVRHINAFARGVRAVNPDANVYVRWVHAWFNPPEEMAATRALVDIGTDIIFGHTDTVIPIQTSSTATVALPGGGTTPVLSIGYDNRDSCKYAPNRCLTSAYWNWGPMVTGLVRQMMNGTWDPSLPIWEQMQSDENESVAYLAPINDQLVSTQITIEVQGWIPQLARPGPEGQQLPFEGPVVDNTGTEWLASGERFTDAQLLRMCWFVDGVCGIDGQPAVVPPACVGDRQP